MSLNKSFFILYLVNKQSMDVDISMVMHYQTDITYYNLLYNKKNKTMQPQGPTPHKPARIKLTPLKKLKQKIHILLPSYKMDRNSAFLLTKQLNKQSTANLPYSPQKILHTSITSKLKTNIQNTHKFKTSFLNNSNYGVNVRSQDRCGDVGVVGGCKEGEDGASDGNASRLRNRLSYSQIKKKPKANNFRIQTSPKEDKLQQRTQKKDRLVHVKSSFQLEKFHNANKYKVNDRVSNLLMVRKRKTYSECSISIAYQNMLPSSPNKVVNPVSRQILRLTKIREMYKNMHQKSTINNNSKQVSQKFSSLVITPQKLLLTQQPKPKRTQPSQQPPPQPQPPSQYILKASLHPRSSIKQKYPQLSTVRIFNTKNQLLDVQKSGHKYKTKIIRHEVEGIQGWQNQGKGRQEEKEQQCEKLYEVVEGELDRSRGRLAHYESLGFRNKCFTEGDQNAFFVTRTNTSLE